MARSSIGSCRSRPTCRDKPRSTDRVPTGNRSGGGSPGSTAAGGHQAGGTDASKVLLGAVCRACSSRVPRRRTRLSRAPTDGSPSSASTETTSTSGRCSRTGPINATSRPERRVSTACRAGAPTGARSCSSATARSGQSRGDFEVFVMNADGSGTRQVTFNTETDDWPSWSPDGDRIVFYRWYGEENLDVMTIRANGRGERNLTRSPGVWDHDAVWSPDGRDIAFAQRTSRIAQRHLHDAAERLARAAADVHAGPQRAATGLVARRAPDRVQRRRPRRQLRGLRDRRGRRSPREPDQRAGERRRRAGVVARRAEAHLQQHPRRRRPDVFTMRADGSRQFNRTDTAASRRAPRTGSRFPAAATSTTTSAAAKARAATPRGP